MKICAYILSQHLKTRRDPSCWLLLENQEDLAILCPHSTDTHQQQPPVETGGGQQLPPGSPCTCSSGVGLAYTDTLFPWLCFLHTLLESYKPLTPSSLQVVISWAGWKPGVMRGCLELVLLPASRPHLAGKLHFQTATRSPCEPSTQNTDWLNPTNSIHLGLEKRIHLEHLNNSVPTWVMRNRQSWERLSRAWCSDGSGGARKVGPGGEGWVGEYKRRPQEHM